jgi:hypothetical protein
MRDLTSGTPATREQNWCDGGCARISWARHTSHTYRPYSIVHAILQKPAFPSGGGHVREHALPEWATCYAIHARGDAPSNSGRFQLPRIKAVACHLAPVARRRTARPVGSPQGVISAAHECAGRPNEIGDGAWTIGRARVTDRCGSREGGASSRCAAADALSRHRTTARTAPVGARATVTAGVCGRDE